jgi:hypothetical protein
MQALQQLPGHAGVPGTCKQQQLRHMPLACTLIMTQADDQRSFSYQRQPAAAIYRLYNLGWMR